MIENLVLRELARRKRTSIVLSYVARYAGFEKFGARLAENAEVIAPVIPVFVPNECRRGAGFLMQSCGGRDLIARNIWRLGWEGFEHPLPDLMARLAARLTGSFLDVGANTGFYSLVVARANPGLAIFAFEPFPPVFELLLGNFALNALPPSTRPVPVALGATSGTAKLYIPVQDHGLVESSCSLNPDFKGTHSAVFTVPVTTVDEFVTKNGVEGVSLMKVDVEGFEHAVFEGAAATIERWRPTVVFELLPHADREAIERFRVQHRYRSYRLHAGGIAPEKVIEFDDDAWNHLMIPDEKAPWMEEVLVSLSCVGVASRR